LLQSFFPAEASLMKKIHGCVLLLCFLEPLLSAEVSIRREPNSWNLDNGHIHLQLVEKSGNVYIRSLRREGGPEWAVANAPLIDSPEAGGGSYRYMDDATAPLNDGGQQLTLRFGSDSGGLISLSLRLYPAGAVIEAAMTFANQSHHDLILSNHVNPVSLQLQSPRSGLAQLTSKAGQHGFVRQPSLSGKNIFTDWLVLSNQDAGESLLVGGEPGIGVLQWQAVVQAAAGTTTVRAGTLLRKDRKTAAPVVVEVSPGETIETPISFFALAKGDSDDAGNETFRFLKRYEFQPPLPDTPLVTYCIWLTQRNSQGKLLSELALAKQLGIDVFYHDASWFEGSSLVPGMNDWSSGLGSYKESREKFPDGMAALSDAVHAAGLKFGVWVDPGNVDAARVASGEIPSEWVATIDGKPLGSNHPSLAPMKQLCLGDPKVVAWIEQQLSTIIEKWHIDWLKWDPSGTQDYECDRTDHGHGKTDGAYAAYRGRLEIMQYLLKRFPNLSGFECDPSLRYARTNPGPQGLLPGGYTNEFITGPMLSPNVWGSLAGAGKGSLKDDVLSARWYSASALDYYFRRRFTHGVTFGNINGMSSQLLSAAPPGFIEAFQRNLLAFKQYRHLLLDDVYHPQVSAAGWNSIQYVDERAKESVVFAFRNGAKTADATVRLRGLEGQAQYRVTSLNDRPGRERTVSGASLMSGVSFHLPNDWLARGDGPVSPEFADESNYGSDILLIRRIQ
jgi:hypothetical protein